MVRWRFSVVLAMLFLFSLSTAVEDDDDDDDESEDGVDNHDTDDGEEDADDKELPGTRDLSVRRAPMFRMTASQAAVTRTALKRPLECYVCAYKPETLLKSCLDPAKHRVHTMTCYNVNEKCFTSVTMKDKNNFEAVVRGCRSTCISTNEDTCCEFNRCNNIAFALPTPIQIRAQSTSKAAKALPPTILFFVTVLLVLQTVVKVSV